MNKVFIHFDRTFRRVHDLIFRVISGRFKPDVETQRQTLIVLAIKRTKYFCPDVMRVIARHLWSMRKSSDELELTSPQTEWVEDRRLWTFDTLVKAYCDALDDTNEYVFLDDEEHSLFKCMTKLIREARPTATIVDVTYSSANQMGYNSTRPPLEILTWMVNHIKDKYE